MAYIVFLEGGVGAVGHPLVKTQKTSFSVMSGSSIAQVLPD